jgi:hypothetical protein
MCNGTYHIQDEKRNEKTLNTESKGIITIEEEYGTLKYERQLSHPREIVWKAITDPRDIQMVARLQRNLRWVQWWCN